MENLLSLLPTVTALLPHLMKIDAVQKLIESNPSVEKVVTTLTALTTVTPTNTTKVNQNTSGNVDLQQLQPLLKVISELTATKSPDNVRETRLNTSRPPNTGLRSGRLSSGRNQVMDLEELKTQLIKVLPLVMTAVETFKTVNMSSVPEYKSEVEDA